MFRIASIVFVCLMMTACSTGESATAPDAPQEEPDDSGEPPTIDVEKLETPADISEAMAPFAEYADDIWLVRHIEEGESGDFAIRAGDVETSFRLVSPEEAAVHGRCLVVMTYLFPGDGRDSAAMQEFNPAVMGLNFGHPNQAYGGGVAIGGVSMIGDDRVFDADPDLFAITGESPDEASQNELFGSQMSLEQHASDDLETIGGFTGDSMGECDIGGGDFALSVLTDSEGDERVVDVDLYNTTLTDAQRECLGESVSSKIRESDIGDGGTCLGVSVE